MVPTRKRKLRWQEELKVVGEAELQEAMKAVNPEEIAAEVSKIPARYLKPFEKSENGVAESKTRRPKQKWQVPDEIAAALTFRLLQKMHGGTYQRLDEDCKVATEAFARKQRTVRAKFPQHEDVPRYIPYTRRSLGERLTKKQEEFEAFFNDPENQPVVAQIDKLIGKLLAREQKEMSLLKKPRLAPERQAYKLTESFVV